MTIAETLIDQVARAEGAVLIAIVFVLVFAESAILLDLFVPGEVGLVVAGAAAEQNGTSLVGIAMAGALGAVAGDSLGYVVARRFGAGLVQRWRWTRRRLRPALRRAEAHYERRGGVTVAVARWVGALRAVVPVVAGSARLPPRQFLGWDVPSAALWATTVASIGFYWGADAAALLDRVGLVVSVGAVVIIALLVWRARRPRLRHRRGDAST